MVVINDTRPDEAQQENLEDLVSHILEEARMVLPGIQALLGFQLVAVLNRIFFEMPQIEQMMNMAAIFLSLSMQFVSPHACGGASPVQPRRCDN
ncbi:MAG: hypothetical protein K2Z81_01460 [Cyanobacteria bacterium]|nr:hypothetical protein [Cyanobacteriota bacterium]